ncbi:hypothetical protein CAPTEDRAFT_187602 [Capitella teleta]|uniref:L-Fucosyltransferase n=1 Tax=Capitella teleta TaxID=283909 RepID=R7UDS7_CAPTE|nr:hypothetical protein CAPTEDRAFT_187602 [Capitella teleta]|eukprot:ELU04144.1 hypothetical protein CAPTEDRAFT_187602 [Capitella teleta]
MKAASRGFAIATCIISLTYFGYLTRGHLDTETRIIDHDQKHTEIFRPIDIQDMNASESEAVDQVNAVNRRSSHLNLKFKNNAGKLTVKTRGRLGNQMFQFAALIGLSERFNMIPTYHRSMVSLTHIFNVSQRPVIVDSEFNLKLKESTGMGGVDEKLLNRISNNVNTRLKGFFQGLDYFSNAEDIIRQELVFQPAIRQTAMDKFEKVNPGLWGSNSTKIGIHIRRGDFLGRGSQKKGRTLAPKEFYTKAMTHMLSLYPESVFIVAEIEKDWASENLKEFGSLFFTGKGTTPEEDMLLLSTCDHVIISSGSFSWWVGWLNKGTVVYFDLYPTIGSPLRKRFDPNKYYPAQWIPMH